MPHKLPDLPSGFDALEPHIDSKTMEIHHDKHHADYVNKLNAALEKHPELAEKNVNDLVSDIDSVPEDIRKIVRNNGGGHANHSLFWEVMSPEGKGGKASEELLKAMKKAFGSGEGCHKTFVEAATNHFGSGWAWIVVNDNKELEIMTTPNQDSPLMFGKKPILGLDVWEHAYYLKYQNKRPEYIENWVKIINWEKVNELWEKASKH
jgi:superoxide dismutase, Fe-Mn family